MEDKKIYGFIYCTINEINLKLYIGQTVKTGRALEIYIGSGTYLKSAIKKYGKENFTKIILEECYSSDELHLKEKQYINILNTRNHNLGYNIRVGGSGYDPVTRGSMSEKAKEFNSRLEMKKKQIESLKKYYDNDKVIENKREIMTNRWKNENFKNKIKNIHGTDEYKEKISNACKEVNSRPKVLEKNRQAQIKRLSSEKERKRMSDSAKEVWSREGQREKVKEIMKKYWSDPKQKDKREKRSKENSGANNPRAKKVKAFNIETNEEIIFGTIKECSMYFNNSNDCYIGDLIREKFKNKFYPWTFEFIGKK